MRKLFVLIAILSSVTAHALPRGRYYDHTLQMRGEYLSEQIDILLNSPSDPAVALAIGKLEGQPPTEEINRALVDALYKRIFNDGNPQLIATMFAVLREKGDAKIAEDFATRMSAFRDWPKEVTHQIDETYKAISTRIFRLESLATYSYGMNRVERDKTLAEIAQAKDQPSNVVAFTRKCADDVK